MRYLLTAAALAAAPMSALATPITIDFEGTLYGYFTYDNSEDETDMTGTVTDLSMHGTITFDRDLGPAPTTSEFPPFFDYTQASMGTPRVNFITGSLTWANGTFVAGPIPPAPPGATEVDDILFLQSWVGAQDSLIIADQFAWQLEDFSGVLSRLAFLSQGEFLADGLPDGSELPDFGTSTNSALIQDFVLGADDRLTGYQAGFNITSVTVRSVPEPGTLTLLIVGLAGLSMGRRRRSHA